MLACCAVELACRLQLVGVLAGQLSGVLQIRFNTHGKVLLGAQAAIANSSKHLGTLLHCCRSCYNRCGSRLRSAVSVIVRY